MLALEVRICGCTWRMDAGGVSKHQREEGTEKGTASSERELRAASRAFENIL